MPEIKNTFSQGKMNKDLDERIIPSGQYRDARNIQISTSEGSDVGTAQNILGNKRVESIIGNDFRCIGAVADEKNNVLYWFVYSQDKDAIIEYNDDGTVTPVIVDTNKNVLNFDYNKLITGINIIDNLLFWTDNVGEPKKINIDRCKSGTANFSTHTVLTKKNGEQTLNESNDPIDIKEEHITVIKKRPNNAPKVKFVDSLIEPEFETFEISFGDGQGSVLTPGEDITVQISMDSSVTPNAPQLLNVFTYDSWELNDILLLSLHNAPGNLPQNYQVKGKITSKQQNAGVAGYSNVGEFIIEIEELSGLITIVPGVYHVTKLIEEDPLFEKEFIRFATRWRYEDGEYSAFSPFTQPVFMAGTFGFHPTKDPYNRGMSNKVIDIRLEDLVSPMVPKDVNQIDILFKKERSTTVYSVDSIKRDDLNSEWHADSYGYYFSLDSTLTAFPASSNSVTIDNNPFYNGAYNIRTENIYAALPSNQILRPWDNVPRKALAQEITANRVVYGNYLQNYNVTTQLGELINPNPELSFETRSFRPGENVNFDHGKPSIKSERTYFLGIVYGDEYGRETPIFTGKKSSVKIPYDLNTVGGLSAFNGAASNSLRLKAKLNGDHPEWANYFKYFIKQTTGEYYNLTMDRVYKADGDDSLWLSFPSSDRNKIQEGDYLTIKKQADIDSQIPVENKIKVVDIKNEAPDGIKFKYTTLGTGGGTATDLTSLFPDSNARPAANVKRISIDRQFWIETEFGSDLDGLTPSDRIALQFSITESGTNIFSKKYHVSAWWKEDAGDDGRYNFLLEDTIDVNDSWVESSVGVMNSTDGLTLSIFKMDNLPAREFEGRFFLKITANTVTQTYLVPGSTNNVEDYQIVARAYSFWLSDNNSLANPSQQGQSANYGVYNVHSLWSGGSGNSSNATNPSQAALKNEKAWSQALKFNTSSEDSRGFFIDNTWFASAQEPGGPHAFNSINNEWDANKSGRMHKGSSTATMQNGGVPVAESGKWWINAMHGIIDVDNYATQNHFGMDGNGDPMGAGHWSEKVYRLYPNSGTPSDGFVSYYTPNTPPIGQIPSDNVYLWTTQQESGSAPVFTNTYERIPGTPGAFMHLSFSSVGVDLHDGNFEGLLASANPTLAETEFKQSLQWIASSGIYYSEEDGYFAGNNQFDAEPNSSIGHNFTEFNASISSAGLEAHDNQFNPGWNNPSAQGVINRLAPGSQFKFEGDPSNVYTILSVDVKYLYNHTPWNPIVGIRPTTGNIALLGNSVSEALHQWAVDSSLVTDHNIFFSGEPGNDPNLGQSSQAGNLRRAIVNFGKANNRRVCYVIQLDKDPTIQPYNPLTTADYNAYQTIRFIDTHIEPGSNTLPSSPAIFETEAKEETDLNIYYEASNALPIKIENDNGYMFAPVGTRVYCTKPNSMVDYDIINSDFRDTFPNGLTMSGYSPKFDFFLRVKEWDGDVVTLESPGLEIQNAFPTTLNGQTSAYTGHNLFFYRDDLSYTKAVIQNVEEISNNKWITKVKVYPDVANRDVGLSYYNCFSFGNGVESNRIRDDFNESFILNGVKASTVLETPYEEERRKYGLIYSGLYNSISGVNDLNQFIQAEKITKDLMPSYGSIQKLYARDKDLVTLCEDKILQIFVDKDVLYNADGNAQLLSTNRVLGEARPFSGEFGISKNPESFASESFRAYFTDKQRGAVLRLSMDGLTPISDSGMHDFFRDNLREGGRLYGSYDLHKKDYNLTIYYADGENLLLNPNFDQGDENFTLGNNVLVNSDFTQSLTIPVSNQLLDSEFHEDPSSTTNWVISSPSDVVWGSGAQPSNIPNLFFDDGSGNGGSLTTGVSNPQNTQGGYYKFNGPNTMYQDIDLGWNNPLYIGNTVKVSFDLPFINNGGGWTSAHKLSIYFVNPDGDGFKVENLIFDIAQNYDQVHCEFHMPIQPADPSNPFHPFFTSLPSGFAQNWRLIFHIHGGSWTGGESITLDNLKVEYDVYHAENWDGTNPTNNQFSGYNLNTATNELAPLNFANQQIVNPITPNIDYQINVVISQVLTPGHLSCSIADDTNQTLVEKKIFASGGVPITDPGEYIRDIGPIPALTTFGQFYQFVMAGIAFGGMGRFHIESITLKSKTPNGGNVLNWSLNGPDLDNLFYDNKKIIFTDSTDDNYSLTQQSTFIGDILSISAGFETNIYRVSLDIEKYQSPLNPAVTSGSLLVEVYNDIGKGFVFEVTGEGTKQHIGKIGEIITEDQSKFSKILFTPNTSFIGQVDNISLEMVGGGDTVTFSEDVRGWTSFKDFVPEFGISVVNQYYTMDKGMLYKHHINDEEVDRNTFYGQYYESSITPVFNMKPELVKNFNTLNYEGTQSRILEFTTVDVPATFDTPGAISTNIGPNKIDDPNFSDGQISNFWFMQNGPAGDEGGLLYGATPNPEWEIDIDGSALQGSVPEGNLAFFTGTFKSDEVNATAWYSAVGLTPGSTYTITVDSDGLHPSIPLPAIQVYDNITQQGGTSVFQQQDSISTSTQISTDGITTLSFIATTTSAHIVFQHPAVFGAGGAGGVMIDVPVGVLIGSISLYETQWVISMCDGEYYNLHEKDGWYVEDIKTDKQQGTLPEFIEKEGKWFNYIKGKFGDVDQSAFNFQGIGIIESIG